MGDIADDHRPFTNFILAACFRMLKNFIMLGVCVGVVCIIYGACIFDPPAGTWQSDKLPPVSPVGGCTMTPACVYFCCCLRPVCLHLEEVTGSKLTKFENSVMIATNAMNFAPMLTSKPWLRMASVSQHH